MKNGLHIVCPSIDDNINYFWRRTFQPVFISALCLLISSIIGISSNFGDRPKYLLFRISLPGKGKIIRYILNYNPIDLCRGKMVHSLYQRKEGNGSTRCIFISSPRRR